MHKLIIALVIVIILVIILYFLNKKPSEDFYYPHHRHYPRYRVYNRDYFNYLPTGCIQTMFGKVICYDYPYIFH